MTPYFRAFLMFLAAGVLAVLFGMTVLARADTPGRPSPGLAADWPKVRTVPVFIASPDGTRAFSWGHTADSRPIRMCFAKVVPLPEMVRCWAVDGDPYAPVVNLTVIEVRLIAPPKTS